MKKAITAKKRNPNDITLRNLRAVKKLIVGLERRIEMLEFRQREGAAKSR